MKKALIITSQLPRWHGFVTTIIYAGFALSTCDSAKKAADLLEKESFNFVLLDNTLFGGLPGEAAIYHGHSPYSVGSKYVAPILQKMNIPFIILGTSKRPTVEITENLLFSGDVFELTTSDLGRILADNKL